MTIQINRNGIFVDGVLKIPTDRQTLVDDVVTEVGDTIPTEFKTINGQTVTGTGDITIPTEFKTINNTPVVGTGNIEIPTEFKTINGQSIVGAGNIVTPRGLLQTHFIHSPNETYGFNVDDDVDLPGMGGTFTPQSDNSYFLIYATIITSKPFVHSISLKKDGNFVDVNPDSNTRHPNALITRYWGSNTKNYVIASHLNYAVENNALADTTLQICMRNAWGGDPYEFYFNNRGAGDLISRSFMIVQEVER